MIINPFRFGAGYSIPYSVRLDGSADYFSRTPGSAGNRKTWTFSCWVKLCNLGVTRRILAAGTNGNYNEVIDFSASDKIGLYVTDAGNWAGRIETTAVFRDTTAWGHLVVTKDASASSAKIYWNGVDQAVTTLTTIGNVDGSINNSTPHNLGRDSITSGFSIGCYITHAILVDGTAITPSSFGETDAGTGSWKPKAPSGLAYGTNGFWLNFANIADLGNDASGNNNDWTPNSLGSTDAVSDTPTNNFATLSYLNPSRSTLSNSNLTASGTTDLPTIVPSSGDWYFEVDGVAKNWTPPAAFPAAAGTYNFGQRAFSNTPTAGHKSLCTANLPVPSIKDASKQMGVALYTGNGAARTITGLDFQPDLVWIKSRSAATDHALYDSVRGVQKRLECNTTDVEATSDGGLTAFNSNGFDLGTLAQVNTNAATYVAWCWKAGGAAVANTDGTISAQVSANPTAGFSVVTYTSTAAAGTVGHGLGSTPKLMIFKDRDWGYDWIVYHTSLGNAGSVRLNTTNAYQAADYFNSTSPTASVFSAGTNGNMGDSGHKMVAYCWAEVPGFSKFGLFTSNASSDNAYVDCGFRPRFLLYKRTNAGGDNWTFYDSKRDTYNPEGSELYANTSGAESTGNARFDFTASGFKCRSAGLGNSGDTYIFAAFAEYPFGGLNTTPGKAR